MKGIRLLLILCFAIVTNIKVQQQLDCESNFKNALSYLKMSENVKSDSLKAIELLKPCLEVDDPNAQLLMGRLYVGQGNEDNYKKAFKLFKKSAKQNNDIAMTDLGILYKYGRGCNLNFNKARKWFEKAAELGNDKAAYSLGYLYLKGFGSIDQDYLKAVYWFEKSDYPMAKYWLGTCYYYGYGVEKNIAKANELLGANFENVVSSNASSNAVDDSSTNVSENIEESSETTTSSDEVLEPDLLGKWKGTLLKYDWSGKFIEQKNKILIEFKNDSIDQTLRYKITQEDQEFTGDVIQIDHTIYFDEAQIKLPHTSFNERIPNEIEYELLSSDFVIKNFNEQKYLIGSLESYIPNFNETGAPLKLVLKKTETFANSNEELSDELLDALAEQEESFIKLYPNPFENDLIISYTLENPSFVEVRITNVNGTKNTIVAQGSEQKKGKHNYFVDGNNLEKGMYLVTVVVDNQKKTRLIIKK
jgi:hypothetical protein